MRSDVGMVLVAIKNSIIAKRESVSVDLRSTHPVKLLSVLRVLYEEGYILNYLYSVDKKEIIIYNVYYKNIPTISIFKVFNKSSFPLYVKYTDLVTIHRFGIDMLLLSTTKGIMPHYKAIKLRLGGKVLCYIR
jgi:small subunit ribosomal protein S8